MNKKTPEEIFQKSFTLEDLLKFQWKILKYMCDVTGIYDIFPEVLLFHRTDLKADIDLKINQENLRNAGGALYKLIMDNAMSTLIERDVIEVVGEYEYGNLKIVLYGRKKKLGDLCNEIKGYKVGDFVLVDKLFPKIL